MKKLSLRALMRAMASIAVVGVVLNQTSAHAAPIVANGDFSANGSSYSGYPGYSNNNGNPSIADWTTNVSNFQPGIDSYAPGMPDPAFAPIGYSSSISTDPEYFAFLQYVGTAPTLTQNITLIQGASYTLSFISAPRDGDSASAGTGISLTDTTLTGLVAANTASTNFQSTTSMVFTALGSSSTITISGPTAANPGDAAPTEDFSDIVIKQVGFVPEPSSYALLGLGMLALLFVGRRAMAKV